MRFLFACAASLLAASTIVSAAPKLVVGIVVDQFRYDYLTRFRKDYNAGFARLLTKGAVFSDAHHEHFPTVTAIGHATFLSGATPSVSGIVGNEWYDRELHKQVSSVSDDQTDLLGGKPGVKGSSPRKLLVSTIGDEMKMSGRGATRVIGISLKDRAAILPVGRMADGAYWFDPATGNFVSSTYYFPQLPAWAQEYNSRRDADKFLGAQWLPFDAAPGSAAKPYSTMPTTANPTYYNAMERTPYGNELIEGFAEQAIVGEQLGKHEAPDLLAVSFSANDYVGHGLGPDSPEVRDISIRTDRLLGKFFAFLDQQVGLDNVLIVLTADHGVSPLPEKMAERRMPGGRIPERVMLDKVQGALAARFGEGQWIVGKSGPAPYLNYELLNEKKLRHVDVENEAANAARDVPNIFRVYTRTQLLNGEVLEDLVARRVRAGFHQQRAADLFIIAQPYYLFEERGTSHGTPFNYDSHVPVLFMGAGVKAGEYRMHIAVNDIAPTLASLLALETPSGSVGRVLVELLQ